MRDWAFFLFSLLVFFRVPCFSCWFVVVVVVVVRSVVSQVSELRRGVVFARVPPQQDTTALFSRLRNSTVRTQPVKEPSAQL